MKTNGNHPRINSIDIVRLVCALLVVTEHTMPFMDINGAVWNAIYRVCVLAVPFFFVVSGFFVACSNDKIKILKQYIRYYLLWTVVYDIWYFVDWAFLGAEYGKYDFLTFMKYRVIEFLGWGSFYHMWFLWALIFCTILAAAFEKLRLEKFLLVLMAVCFIIGTALTPYYGIIITSNGVLRQFVEGLFEQWWFGHVSDVLIRGIPYYYLGYWLAKWNIAERYKVQKWQLAALALLYIMEHFVVTECEISRDPALTFFMYPLTAAIVLWLLQHPFPKQGKAALFSKESADYIYFIHALVIEVLIKIFGRERMTLHFVCAMTICMLLAICRYKIRNKRYVKLQG